MASPKICPRCHRLYRDKHALCSYDQEPLVTTRRIDLIEPSTRELEGERIGDRYVLRGFIGRGAMAKIYLAEDLETHEPVAVKLLDPEHARVANTRERFLREARAAAVIGHENIVDILDAGIRADRTPYVVMEFLFGETLGQLVRRQGPLSAELALPILIDVASALAAAHRENIVHRDVKPDNIFLVGEPGEPYTVKVVDFGLAKMDADSNLTALGIAVGTLEYMSPEQAVSDRVGPRADVYGLGAVMFRMLTGELPFPYEEPPRLLAAQLVEPPPAPESLRPGLDPALAAILLTAMRKHPDNRYPTMVAFGEDLERALGNKDGLFADHPLRISPDAYVPVSPFAQNVARLLYRRSGMTAPDWPNDDDDA